MSDGAVFIPPNKIHLVAQWADMVTGWVSKHLDACIEHFMADIKHGKREWVGSEDRIYFDEFQVWFVERERENGARFWRTIKGGFGRPTTIRSLKAVADIFLSSLNFLFENAGDRGRKELYNSLKGQVNAHINFHDLLSIRVLKYNQKLCKDYGIKQKN